MVGPLWYLALILIFVLYLGWFPTSGRVPLSAGLGKHLSGQAIFLTVFALHLIGDGLRDALDPRSDVRV